MGLDIDPTEGGLTPTSAKSLDTAVRHGVNEQALVIYGRWWQLETWLRELVYLELGARYGVRSADNRGSVVGGTNYRQEVDAEWTHMLGPDNDNPLAYLDFSKLHDIVFKQWELFAPVMPRKASWEGSVGELTRIRHRIAHLRQPHPDDLSRLEQALRDLERGAFIAAASFNDRWKPNLDDPYVSLTADWVLKQSQDAQRLVDHADNNYGVSFEIRRSRRPWASKDTPTDEPGHLWHIEFYTRDFSIDFERLWNDDYFAQLRELLLFLEANSPNSCTLTFSAADGLQEISDNIGDAFEALLQSGRARANRLELDRSWRVGLKNVSYKIVSGTMWNIINESTVPVSLFGTGRETTRAPKW